MSEFETLMREYLDIEYALDEAKGLFSVYNEKATKKKAEVSALQKSAASIQHDIGKYMSVNGVVESE